MAIFLLKQLSSTFEATQYLFIYLLDKRITFTFIVFIADKIEYIQKIDQMKKSREEKSWKGKRESKVEWKSKEQQ